jgi:hypothetical protein
MVHAKYKDDKIIVQTVNLNALGSDMKSIGTLKEEIKKQLSRNPE